ncbi:unnamed protein product [Amoebophrya sp. A25]|nr:unnamed protein product [Amoebophrya sp. A25]|eukprot:GSA25T00015425001.1
MASLAPGRTMFRRHLSTLVLGSCGCVFLLRYQSHQNKRHAVCAGHDGGTTTKLVSIDEWERLRQFRRNISCAVFPKSNADGGKDNADREVWITSPSRLLGLVFAGAFVYRASGIFTQIMEARCRDAAYQIRRPEFLQTKIFALKAGLFGNLLLPVGMLAGFVTAVGVSAAALEAGERMFLGCGMASRASDIQGTASATSCTSSTLSESLNSSVVVTDAVTDLSRQAKALWNEQAFCVRASGRESFLQARELLAPIFESLNTSSLSEFSRHMLAGRDAF